MKNELTLAFETEMAIAQGLIGSGQLDQAMRHLEIAHVLGQRYVGPHVLSHWWMLKIALRRRSLSDSYGQALRIVLGALGSAIGVVPIGNTGGSDISMFTRMPISPRIAALIERDRGLRRNDRRND